MTSSKSPCTFHCTNCDWKKFIPSDKDKMFIDQKFYTHCPVCKEEKLTIITGKTFADMLLNLVQNKNKSNNESRYNSTSQQGLTYV